MIERLLAPLGASLARFLERDAAPGDSSKWQLYAKSGGLYTKSPAGTELGVASKLLEDTTVNLDSTMTSAEIQALIDAQPRNLGGYRLTFLFADGTYSLDTLLKFMFFYGGYLNIEGNNGESGVHTNQAVVLDFSSGTGLFFSELACYAFVENLRVDYNESNGFFFSGVNHLFAQGCYAKSDGTGGNGFVIYNGTTGWLDDCTVGDGNVGYYADKATLYVGSRCEAVSGSEPSYGCKSSALLTRDATITGTTANDQEVNGGQVFS